MNKWEYKIVSFAAKRKFLTGQFDAIEIEKQLNAMGSQGWELVTMSYFPATAPTMVFKRAS